MEATATAGRLKAGGAKKGKKAGMGEEARRKLVGEYLLKRMSVREIAEAMKHLPKRKRPANYSAPTIGRDIKKLREEWGQARAADVEQHVSEEVARLNELEKVWWAKALDAEPVATDKVLAIQRQRAQFLRIGPGAGTALAVTAAAAGASEKGAVTAVKVRVELVDDWRDA